MAGQPFGTGFALVLISCAVVLGQSTDIVGWNGLAWETKRPAALKALQSLHVREQAGGLMVDDYRAGGVSYQVELLFAERGLRAVLMTANDEGRSFENMLADLTRRYGKPTLRSEYDGDREITRTTWNWVKAHGSVSLASEFGDGTSQSFTVTYEARR